ncbi:MAG: hypothetical protein KJZ93_17255 [Caldilineaceae bacterium]|nr:hypothetical protein [Caldilineaceae bacterium]
MEELQPRTFTTNIALGAGAAIGLVVGLLIGWVFWPVQWQGATLNELYPDAKADYLAAVAESYVMYGSPEAAEVARRRVAVFGDALGEEFEAAIAHFSAGADPDKQVRISNLGALAGALGVSLPNLVGVTQGDSAPAQAAPVDTPGTSAGDGPGWVGWLLATLLAAALLLGGLYVLLFVTRRRSQPASEEEMAERIDDEFRQYRRVRVAEPQYVAWDEGPSAATGPDDDLDDGRARNGLLESDEAEDGDAGWRSQAPVRHPVEQDEYEFDDDPEDFTDFAAPRGAVAPTARGHYTQFSLESEPDHRPASSAMAEDEDLDDDLDNDLDEANSIVDSGWRAPRPHDAPMSSAPGGEEAGPAARAAPSLKAASAQRPTAAAATLVRGTVRYKLLELYIAHYQMGIRDYDEAHPIVEPASGEYIGECGMGVSTKNGLLQNNPEQVVALEVWLFDKANEKSLGNQTRVLLSEYAVDQNLEQAFLKERQDDPRPFTAQPGVKFQLEGPNLLLDCTISEAIYHASGPNKGMFQSVQVEMSVYKRN